MSRNTDYINQRERDIPVLSGFGATYISDFVYDEIDVNKNLVINGEGEEREYTLYHRILQLYEEADGPIIYLSAPKDTDQDNSMVNAVLKTISNRIIPYSRRVYNVRNSYEASRYNPLLELDAGTIGKAIRLYAKGKEDFNNEIPGVQYAGTILKAICTVLDRYGYARNAYNISRILNLDKNDLEKLMRAEGLIQAYQYIGATSGEASRDLGLLVGVLQQFVEDFDVLSDYENGVSLTQKVLESRGRGERMPIFFFQLPGGCRYNFLNYLSAELEKLSDYCTPYLVIDNIKLYAGGNPAADIFYDYVKRNSPRITLSGETTSTMVRTNELDTFLADKRFIMILLQSGASGEGLAGELGEYYYILEDRHTGKDRHVLDLIAHEKHRGIVEHTESRKRISGDDLRNLGEHRMYVTYGSNAVLVKNVIFSRDIRSE